MAAAVTQTHEFYEALWGDKPEHLWMLVWTLADKRSVWFQSPEKAANYAAGRTDCYTGVGLSPEAFGAHNRCEADKVAGIAGLWADVDFRDGSGAHKSDKLPESEAAALAFVETELELKPSLVVHSGHGIQAWWLFPELWLFADDAERQQAQRLSEAWQGFVYSRGLKHGWQLDKTHDLARVLRIPGTINAKVDPVEARLLENRAVRWLQSDAWQVAGLVPEEMRHALNGHGERRWKEALTGSEVGFRNQDLTSLAGLLIGGLADLESEPHLMAALTSLFNANARSSEPLDEKEVRTIFYSMLKKDKKRRASEQAEEEFLERTPGAELVANRPEKLSQIGKQLGCVEGQNTLVEMIVKRGREESEISLFFKNGREVLITDIFNQAATRRAIASATSPESTVMVPRYKAAKWDWLVKIILSVATDQPAPDMERKHRAEGMISEYLEECPPSEDDEPGAVSSGGPFIRGDRLFVNSNSLHHWMRSRGYLSKGTSASLYQIGFGQSEVVSVEVTSKEGNKTRIQRRYRSRSVTACDTVGGIFR